MNRLPFFGMMILNVKNLARWLTFVCLLMLPILLAACGEAMTGTQAVVHLAPSVSATLLPPYIATAQNAQGAAQATIAAAQAAEAEAQLAQAYLMVTQTAASLAQKSAASTEQTFARQTEQAVALTATAQSAQATATQQAHWAEVTVTAQAEAVLAAHATATASIIQTAAAWPLTATPLSATQIAILARVQDTQRRAYWQQFVIPFWVFIGAICLSTFVVLIVLTYRRLIPAAELWLRTRHSPDGETLILLEKDQGIHILQPGRNFGAALLNQPDRVTVDGIAPAGPEWQDRVVGREQAVQLARALTDHRKRSTPRLLAQPKPASLPAGEVVEGEVVILPPEDPRIRPLLDEVEPKLFNEGETPS